VASDKLSVSEVRERHVAVQVILHVQKSWQEPAMAVEVQVKLHVKIASREPAKDVEVQENQHEVVVSDVWNA